MVIHRKAGVMSGNISALLILQLLVLQVSCFDWLEHHKPVQKSSYFYNADELNTSSDRIHTELSEFQGNNSHTDHFKLLKEDGTSVLVGARNVIYNLSLPNLIEYKEERIDWTCTPKDRANCDLKGKSYSDCQNYIRVLSVISPTKLLVLALIATTPCADITSYRMANIKLRKSSVGKATPRMIQDITPPLFIQVAIFLLQLLQTSLEQTP